MKPFNRLVLCLAAIGVVAGCGGAPSISDDPSVTLVDPDSVHHFSAVRAVPTGYHLATGDVFDVDFLFEKTLNTRVKVRPDGFVALPVVGEVPATGRTPAQLDSILTAAYATYYRTPEITVNVLQFAPPRVYIMGEVRNERPVDWEPGMSMIQAIAHAGGAEHTGNLHSVVLLRRLDSQRAYAQRIDLQSYLNGSGNAFDLMMQPYDIIYVPKTFIARINQFVDQFFTKMLAVPVMYLRTWEAFHTDLLYQTFTTTGSRSTGATP